MLPPMLRTPAVAPLFVASVILAGCGAMRASSGGADPIGDADDGALVQVWAAPVPGLTRVEVWLKTGSLDSREALVAATMAEIWASRARAESWVTPSLTVLALESTSDELEASALALLSALADPPREEEITPAVRAVTEARRRQSHAPERDAVAAAFAAMGLTLALPLGEEEDAAPSLAALREYAMSAIRRDRVRVLFIGDAPARLVDTVERKVTALGTAGTLERRAMPASSSIGVREGTPAWALVATLGSLERAELVRSELKSGPFDLGDARVELAPSRAGAFLVVSGRGAPSPASLRAWVLEIRRLASWAGSVSTRRALDLRERARAKALQFAATPDDPREATRFDLGLAVRAEGELDREALEAALEARVEPVSVPSDPRGAPETSIVTRLPALFSGEPASDAGRGALVLHVVSESCARLGLRVTPGSERGDGVLVFAFAEPPRLGEIQALARCLLRETPSALAWESGRTRLLDELARDPLHTLFEALAASLYPSAPSSAIPLQTRALRHRSGDGRMREILEARRDRGGIGFTVSGLEHEGIAAQLGAILAALPSSERPPSPLANGRPDIGPRVVELDVPSVFAAGVRLDGSSPVVAAAFAASWAKRTREKGLLVIRALSGGHPAEGFAIIAVPLGGSDRESLRASLEAAMPTEDEFREALRELVRERAYRFRADTDEHELDARDVAAPRVTGRSYAIGIERE
jgi:hypothetical protein